MKFGIIASTVGMLALCAGSAHATTYNADLANGVYYGAGNGASPQEFTVENSSGIEIGLRAKLSPNFGSAGASPAQLVPVGNTYFVSLGDTFNFDYSFDPTGSTIKLANLTASLTITNLLTGHVSTLDPTNPLLGNATSGSVPGGYQNSERISFGFLNAGYNPNIDDTYDISFTLTGANGFSLTDDIKVQVGAGFTPAVPEPSTWAMMILGFAGVGFMAYRRRNQAAALAA